MNEKIQFQLKSTDVGNMLYATYKDNEIKALIPFTKSEDVAKDYGYVNLKDKIIFELRFCKFNDILKFPYDNHENELSSDAYISDFDDDNIKFTSKGKFYQIIDETDYDYFESEIFIDKEEAISSCVTEWKAMSPYDRERRNNFYVAEFNSIERNDSNDYDCIYDALNIITTYINETSFNLESKLENLLNDSKISEKIHDKCSEPANFSSIENKLWELVNDSNSEFYYTEYYDKANIGNYLKDPCKIKEAKVYDCDFLYMVAIASVLKLRIPETSDDKDMFFE